MGKVISSALISLVRFYQVAVSPMLGQHCRFEPSCSQYMIDAISKKGPLAGVWAGMRRVLRCHPFNPGGHDPVK